MVAAGQGLYLRSPFGWTLRESLQHAGHMADLAEDPTRMNLIDSLWLDVKQTEGPVAVGAVLEFEGRAPSIDKIRERVDETLVHAPRLRQKPEHSRTGILQGKWVDDNPDLEQHVTKRKISKGGLEAEISKLLVMPMDTHRPLWDISVLTGYAPGQWALVWRLHHAVADGEGVTMLVGRTIDMSPDGMVTMTDALVAQADAARAARRGPVDVTLDAGDKLRTALVGAFSDAAAIAAATPATVRALLRMTPAPPTELAGTPSPGRDWRHIHLSLSAVKAAGKQNGATVNDVIMAAVTNGYRKVLLSHGEDLEGREVRAVMPVSRRTPGDTRSNNQVSAMPIALPVGIGDPQKRLKRVVKQTQQGKKSLAPAVLGSMQDMATKITPAPLQEFFVSHGGWATAWVTDTLVTNVRGPQQPTYFCGQEIKYLSPIIPIGGGLRTVVGITGDSAHASEDALLLAGIQEGIDELVAGAPK